jgi:hypothetical protein
MAWHCHQVAGRLQALLSFEFHFNPKTGILYTDMDVSKTPSSPSGPSSLNPTTHGAAAETSATAQELLGGHTVSHRKGNLIKTTFSAFKHFAQTIAAKLSSLLSTAGRTTPTNQKDLLAALPDFKANVTMALQGYAVGNNPSELPDKFAAVVLDANRAQFSFTGLHSSAHTDREALGKMSDEEKKASLEKTLQDCFGKERSDPTLKVALNLTNQNIFADCQVQQMLAGNYVNHAEMSIEQSSYQLTQNKDGSYTLTATNRAEGFANAQVMEEGQMQTQACDPATSRYALEVQVRIAPETQPGAGPQIKLLSCTRTFHIDPTPGDHA